MDAQIGSRRAGAVATLTAVAALASGAASAQTIAPAPAFNAERLSTLPRDEWITNGGTISNQRYSPLDLINRGNVAGLKGLWRTGLESGTGPGNSAQAQILVFRSGCSKPGAVDLDNGARLYREACQACHGPTGGGAAFTSALTREAALGVIAAGRNTMPAYRASYTDQELRDIAAYVAERLAAGRN